MLYSKMGLLDEKASSLKVIDCSLRLVVIPFSIASIWLTVTSHQENSDYGNLVYSNLTGLKFMVVAYLMVTAAAAAAEILYLAYNGDQEVTWSEACTTYGKFCHRMKLVLALHVVALCCFLLLAVISAYRLFSRFSPPLLPSKEAEEEQN